MEMFKRKTIEIWDIKHEGVWFELHVDATEENRLIDLFSEAGEVTQEQIEYFENLIKKFQKD